VKHHHTLFMHLFFYLFFCSLLYQGLQYILIIVELDFMVSVKKDLFSYLILIYYVVIMLNSLDVWLVY
jgi:hypothetical protein